MSVDDVIAAVIGVVDGLGFQIRPTFSTATTVSGVLIYFP